MKILQVCSKSPFPPVDGGSLAMNALTQGLIKNGCEVYVLAVSTPKHFIDETKLDNDYKLKTNFQSEFIDTSVKGLDAFLNLFSTQSYNIIRFYSKAFEDKMISIIEKNNFDIIHLESLWMSVYVQAIRNKTKAKIVLRSHNVEYLIWQRLANDCTNPVKKWYFKLLEKRLKKYEYDLLNKFDAILPITDIDLKYYQKMGASVPLLNIPFGIDMDNYKVDNTQTEYPAIFHIGAMDWMPNVNGINWFLKNVWNNILQTNSQVKLYLAGRNMPSDFANNIKNVVVEGEVDDSKRFINSKSIMIVPLTSGGGMRIKIIEGMALGKTIISTSVGAEGIVCENNKHIIIADSADEFKKALLKCISDKTFCEQIGKNAFALAHEKYDNFVICAGLMQFYKTLMFTKTA